jgi:two-component system sensor histidine kinase DesK
MTPRSPRTPSDGASSHDQYSEADLHRRLQISPRLIVLGALLVSFGWALVFPLRLSRPPSGLLATTYVVGLALFGGALALVLRSAVSPEQSHRTRIALVGALVIVTLGLLLPAYAWAVPGQEPWAWWRGSPSARAS